MDHVQNDLVITMFLIISSSVFLVVHHICGSRKPTSKPVKTNVFPVQKIQKSHDPKQETVNSMVNLFNTNVKKKDWIGKTIGICGPIGAGKSTLGKALEQFFCSQFQSSNTIVRFFPEQVNEEALQIYLKGQPVDFVNETKFYVNIFANDTMKTEKATSSSNYNPYAHSFQLYMLAMCHNRMQQSSLMHDLSQGNSIAIVDRTPWDNVVFEEANRLFYHSIGPKEHEFYQLVQKTQMEEDADIILYLDIDPETTLERIKMRGSMAESSYAQMFHYLVFLHDIWFVSIVQHYLLSLKKNIRVINWNHFDTTKLFETLTNVTKSTIVICNDFENEEEWSWSKNFSPSCSNEKRKRFKRRIMDKIQRGEDVMLCR